MHFGILEESEGGGRKYRHFLFNPLCVDGNASSALNKISRYDFQTAERQLAALSAAAETDGGVI